MYFKYLYLQYNRYKLDFHNVMLIVGEEILDD